MARLCNRSRAAAKSFGEIQFDAEQPPGRQKVFRRRCHGLVRPPRTTKDEVESIISGIAGFVSYTLIRTADGGATVTVCQDKGGTDESLRAARE